MSVLLACTTFPLIWVGGLVTTYDAGMAVPDWPGTYGYNLFLYPWQSWFAGPWDLFIEHGHRLLGAVTGLLCTAVMLLVFWNDRRRWLKVYAVVMLITVIAQGLLGGLRVLLDGRQIAMVHGCTGPIFFAMAVAMCVFTSRLWKEAAGAQRSPIAGKLSRLTVVTCCLTYAQLVAGAFLRHIPVAASPQSFRVGVFFHLLLAAAVTVHILLLTSLVLRNRGLGQSIRRPVSAMFVLIGIQLSLGAATWVVNYAWPNWIADFGWSLGYTTIEAKGLWQSLIVTAHAAVGSLILAVSVLVATRSMRLFRQPAGAVGSSAKNVTMLQGVVA